MPAEVVTGQLQNQLVNGVNLIGVDSTNNQIMVGNAGTWTAPGYTINVQGPQTALTTVTTAQTMFSFALPAGLQNITRKAFQIVGNATFSNGATTPAITVSLKIGAVTLCSVVGANNANNNTTSPIQFGFWFQTTTTGTSGTDESHGWLDNAVSAAWASGTAIAGYVDNNTAASTGYDHTISNTLVVQIAATATLTSVVPRQFILSALN